MLQSAVDIVWVLLCALLVFVMHGGSWPSRPMFAVCDCFASGSQ